MLGFIKRHKILTAVAIVVIAIVAFVLLRPKPPLQGDFITLAKTSVVQEVEVTGRTEPAEKVDLAAESSGRVSGVLVSVGRQVAAGDTLVRVDDTDLRIQLQRDQLELRRAELALEEAQKGSAEDVTSQNDLARAYEAKINAEADLKQALDEGFNFVADAFLDLPTIVTTLRDIQNHSYLSETTFRNRYDRNGQQLRQQARDAYFEARAAFDRIEDDYQAASRNSDPTVIKQLILDTYETTKQIGDAMKVTQNLLDFVERQEDEENTPEQLAADNAELDELSRSNNEHQINLLSSKDAITEAEQAIADAVRVINEKTAANKDQVSGDDLEVENRRLDVEQALLDVEATLAEIDKRSIISPIDGIVTDIAVKRGELLGAGTVAVSVISATNFQVGANLPEVDVTKIKVNMSADVTLDAYSNDVVFPMMVSAIDPAETVVEGVPVYKVTLQFVKADDRIKSGLTADITIKSERRDNVLAVPQRSVIAKNGGKYVQVREGETIVDKPVTTGLRGSDGTIEITSGLVEGQQVVVFAESE